MINLNKKRINVVLRFVGVLMMICLSNHHIYAQSTNVKIDTIEMTVNIGAFSDADPKNSNTRFTRQTYIIKPKSEEFHLKEIVSQYYKPQFDGIFIINDDQLATYGIIIKRSGKFLSTNNPVESQVKFQLLPFGTGKFKYFCGLTVTAIWTKYEINNFDHTEISQRKLYEKNTSHINQKYNYYLIKTIKNIQRFYH